MLPDVSRAKEAPKAPPTPRQEEKVSTPDELNSERKFAIGVDSGLIVHDWMG